MARRAKPPTKTEELQMTEVSDQTQSEVQHEVISPNGESFTQEAEYQTDLVDEAQAAQDTKTEAPFFDDEPQGPGIPDDETLHWAMYNDALQKVTTLNKITNKLSFIYDPSLQVSEIRESENTQDETVREFATFKKELDEQIEILHNKIEQREKQIDEYIKKNLLTIPSESETKELETKRDKLQGTVKGIRTALTSEYPEGDFSKLELKSARSTSSKSKDSQKGDIERPRFKKVILNGVNLGKAVNGQWKTGTGLAATALGISQSDFLSILRPHLKVSPNEKFNDVLPRDSEYSFAFDSGGKTHTITLVTSDS